MLATAMLLGLPPPTVDAPPLRTTPAYENLVPSVSLPPSFEDRRIYYQSFDVPAGDWPNRRHNNGVNAAFADGHVKWNPWDRDKVHAACWP